MPVEFFSTITPAHYEPYFDALTRATARAISSELKDNVKDEIPDGSGNPVGNWKGWEATGALRNDIVVGADKKFIDGWKAKVRLRKGSAAEKYAVMHEVGGIIRARTMDGMWFHGLKSDGSSYGLMNRMKVTIRPKGFFKKGLDKTWNELDRTLKSVVIRGPV